MNVQTSSDLKLSVTRKLPGDQTTVNLHLQGCNSNPYSDNYDTNQLANTNAHWNIFTQTFLMDTSNRIVFLNQENWRSEGAYWVTPRVLAW